MDSFRELGFRNAATIAQSNFGSRTSATTFQWRRLFARQLNATNKKTHPHTLHKKKRQGQIRTFSVFGVVCRMIRVPLDVVFFLITLLNRDDVSQFVTLLRAPPPLLVLMMCPPLPYITIMLDVVILGSFCFKLHIPAHHNSLNAAKKYVAFQVRVTHDHTCDVWISWMSS